MVRGLWATAVLLAAVGGAAPASAQPLAPLAPPDRPPAPSRPAVPDSILGAPVAVKGEPVRTATDPTPTTNPGGLTLPVGYSEPPSVQKPGRAAALGAPTTAAPVSAEAVESVVRRSGGAGGAPADPVNDFLTRRSSSFKGGDPEARKTAADPLERPAWKFGDRVEGVLGHRAEWFRSDHAFDGFISPVTNPFLFEDPRALTEVRPIFIYQKVPGGHPDFPGGNISFFGTQARLAVTDRLSFTIHKFGGVWFNTGSGSLYENQSGFAEFWFGPKYTFIRSEETGSLLAGGLQFQVPTSSGAFQNAGSLSLVPYVTYGQNFLRDLRVGSFNGLVGTGYSFSTNSARSDYYYLSGHIDLDVLNYHHFYPLFEMNWFLYTTNGKTLPLGTEGRDLINFGGQAKGHGLLTGAFGARYKISECAQMGAAFEIPFAGPKDLFQYRFTIDFILRY